MQVYSITDKPVTCASENLLGVEGYAQALTDFILGAEAPLTIGMQGEWGTGKTSLMHLVREKLVDEHRVATSWVNTWEYSLFKEAHETTPVVLKGLMENLIVSCKSLNCWPPNAWDDNKETLAKGLKAIGRFAAKVAVQKTTGQNVDFNLDDPTSLLSEVAELKNEIKKIVGLIMAAPDNPPRKIVFFVDDLDRIDPPVAVEILESLKNIFDIDHCIFVLAIDYDVVIKGLEKKFGKKTEENEREFRSFFDKIIQVPFTMPTGAYEIANLLAKKFAVIGIELDEKRYRDYEKVIRMTVGENPRSIKRFINSFSLLRKIRIQDAEDDLDPLEDLCLFILLGVQISYPRVFRLIARSLDYRAWDREFAESIGVSEIPEPRKNNSDLDEPWELILWAHCQREAHTRARALLVIRVLNFLHKRLGDRRVEMMERAMAFAAMTTVDDSGETAQAGASGRGRKDDEVAEFFASVSRKLLDRLDPDVTPDKKSRWAGVDRHVRYFNFWYAKEPWGNWVVSYRINYYSEDDPEAPKGHFVIKLQAEPVRLTKGGVPQERVDALRSFLASPEIDGYCRGPSDQYPSIQKAVPNVDFNEATADAIVDCASELIRITKPQVDAILTA